MIHSIEIENFYSIDEKITLDFVSKTSEPKNTNLYSDVPFGKKVSKINFLIGANASGKSNALRAISFVRYMIVDSMSRKNLGKTLSFPFLSNYRSPSKISIVFSSDDDSVYRYTIEVRKNIVQNEELSEKNIVNIKATWHSIYKRIFDKKQLKYNLEFRDDVFVKKMSETQNLVNKNPEASLIAILYGYDTDDGIIRKIESYWQNVFTNVNISGSDEENNSMMLLAHNTLARIYKNPKMRELASHELKKNDIGFDSIIERKIQLENNQDAILYDIAHNYDGRSFETGIMLESSGSQRMIILLEKILSALSAKNGVAAIDEFDAYLHPDLFTSLYKIFTSTLYNTNNTQLIFSSHNYTPMARLEKQQMTLFEKSDNGQTEVLRLDDMNGIRSDDNYYTKYLAGAYGATPNIEE